MQPITFIFGFRNLGWTLLEFLNGFQNEAQKTIALVHPIMRIPHDRNGVFYVDCGIHCHPTDGP